MPEIVAWPPDFIGKQRKALVAEEAAAMIARLCPWRRSVVQAGGCAGLWPIALAQYFNTVFTFEPQADNFRCLLQNIHGHGNIYAYQGALGAALGKIGLMRTQAGAGLWRVTGEGDISMVTLDSCVRYRTMVDALVLDVEGSELEALQGAEQTIDRCRPLLWFEFRTHKAEIQAWLRAHDYSWPVAGLGRDKYSLPIDRLPAPVVVVPNNGQPL